MPMVFISKSIEKRHSFFNYSLKKAEEVKQKHSLSKRNDNVLVIVK